MNTKLRWGFLCFSALFTLSISQAQVIINEVSSNNVSTYPDNDGDFTDWIELYNSGASPVNLLNYKLSDSAAMPARWAFPSISIPANGYLTVFASGKNKAEITDHWEMIVKEDDLWKYIVPSSSTSTAWENPSFDDSGWDSAPGGFGYGAVGETTIVPDGTISVFMRKTFTVADSAAIREMIFYADYDDAFVVFLNGEEITRDNISATTPAYNDLASTAYNSGGVMQEFRIDPAVFKPLLTNGTNLLAIEVHNVASSSDLLMRPFLMVGITNTSVNYEATPAWFTPPASGQAYLHTNFSINANGGETITLADPSNTIINSVSVPALGVTATYGRYLNGSSTWSLLSPATPNASNSTSTAYAGYLNATVAFSIPAGFYSGSQTVSCTCSDATAELRYTTDGSKPTISATLYSGAISVSTTRVLRAACFKTGYITQNYETNTYFIGDPASNIAVFSISTHPNNFFHADTGMYVMGPNASGASPHYGANFWQDWEREVHIEYFDKGKANRFEQDCGIKIFGGWSRANAMKSMRLVPDEKYGKKRITYPLFSEKPYVGEFSGVHLRNGGNDFNYSHLRDQTNHRALQSEPTILGNTTHIDFSAYEPVLVFINGSYWGIHHLRERFSKGYFEENHNVSDYEMLEMDGDVVKVDNAHFLNMTNFIQSNDMTSTTNYNTVKGWLDIENFADYFIAETYHTNWDWPNNNVKYWRALPDGKWRYLYYDTDFAFAMFNFISASTNELSDVINSKGGNDREGIPNPHGPMLKKLLTNTEFKNYFVNRYADLMNTIYQPVIYKSVFDGLKSEMSPNMARHFVKWPQNANNTAGWDSECSSIRSFIDARLPYARDHVQSTFSLAGQVTTTLQVNPAGAGVIKISTIVPDQYPWTGVYYNGVPVTLTAIANPGYAFANWSSSAITLASPSSRSITLNIGASNTFTANFTTTTSVPKITINEINYNSDSTYSAGDWIELYNYGNASMDLSGWKFKDANEYNSFIMPNGTTLGAGQYLVIVADVVKFTALHPGVTNYIGPFNFSLSNGGELLRLYDNVNRLYLSMAYDDVSPWPLYADGEGTTLELIDPTKNLSDGSNWYDGCRGGSPGKAYVDCPCADVNLGPDKVLCSEGGTVLLNTGLTAHPDRVFKWYFNGALLPVTTPSLSASSAGVYEAVVDSFGCIKNDAVTLTSDLAINLGPDITLCNPVTTTLDTKLTGSGITYEWHKNGTVIPKETSSTLFVKLAGTYQVTATASGCTTQTDEVVVTSDAAIPGDQFRCDEGPVTLTVSGPGTYEWYETATGGSPLDTSSSFTTPSLTTSKTYYVKDAGSFGGTVGPASPAEVGGEIWHGQHWDPEDDLYKMKFDIFQPLFINAVTVFARGPQSVTVRVLEPDKTTIKFTKTVTISAAGENRIPLGFQFLAADVKNGYYMDLIGTTGELEYNGDGGNTDFPYVAADYMQITRTSASYTPNSSWYFYLYKWEYGSSSGGSCERVPVTATIGCSLMATITPESSTNICQGGSVVLKSNTGSGYTHQWKKDGVDILNATSSSYTATTAGNYSVFNTYDGESLTSPEVEVTVTPSPSTASADVDQTICETTAILAGNTPTIGTGTWTVVSGTASFTDASHPASGVIGLGVGANTLRWSISNSPCTASTDDVVIKRSEEPTTALAGSDQTVCLTTATLAGNAPVAGTGTWTVVSGTATITDPTSPISEVTALGVGTNTLRWTISNAPCTPSSDEVVITRSADPTPASAGTDQNVCATTAILSGNAPIEGEGTWSLVSGTATISDPLSPTSAVTDLGIGYNTLRWTISNSPCTPSTEDVVITRFTDPTPAVAGDDQIVCLTTAILNGNAPAIGTGSWSVVSGTATISDLLSPTSAVTDLGVGTNTLRWTISNSPCTSSTDDVVITRQADPTPAAAGADQTVCLTTTILEGNVPAIGTGTWTVVSGTATISDPLSPTSAITDLGLGATILRWTISNSPCTASTDDVTITRSEDPTPASAGVDQEVCTTTATLSGNAPAVGTGSWTVVSGTATITDPASPISEVTALGVGANTLRWTISNSPCTPSTEEVVITRFADPTPAAAGADQTVCTSTATLAGNVPVVGTGSWTVVSGTAIVTDPANPGSGLTALEVGTHILRWTISNGPCTSSADDLTITRIAEPTPAAAGDDQDLCTTTTILAGNAPAIGTGSWTVVSGTATISDPASPTSAVTAIAIGTNTLRWTISNSPCAASADDLILTRFADPTPATAGADQTVCTANATLAGNTPSIGTGSWSVVSGTATVTDPASPTSGVTGLVVGTNTFVWTISSGNCTVSEDEIIIIREDMPTVADAGTDQDLCVNNTNLAATPLTIGTGVWSIVSGTAVITDPASPTSEVTGLGLGTNVLRWTTDNGTCPSSSDEVSITRTDPPTPANAGADQSVCTTSSSLAGNTPVSGTGVWTLLSGSGTITSPSSPTSGVTGLGVGDNIFTWTITSGSCGTLSDDVVITLNPSSPASVTISPSSNPVCAGSTVTLTASPINGGTPSYAWKLNGVNVGTDSEVYTLSTPGQGDEVSVEMTSSLACATGSPATSTITISVDEAPSTASAGLDQNICITTATLAGDAPAVGTGTWTVVSGTASITTASSPTSGVTGLGTGTNILRWTISNGACPSSSDDVVILVNSNPTISNAGPDKSVCTATTALSANSPTVGTGVWSLVSGTATITNYSDPLSTISDLEEGSDVILRWTIRNGSCTPSQDDVTITRINLPTTADAGADQNICASSTTLSGNVPAIGTGSWSVVSGTAVIASPADPATAVSGLGTGATVLRWTISNGSCVASTDEVTINVTGGITTAFAGSDLTVCTGTASLSANSPSLGTGTWTVVSGPATVTTPSDPASTVSGLGVGDNIFRWTITNSPCAPSQDEVTITRTDLPTTADAGADQTICASSTTLSGNVPAIGTGSWSVVSGTAVIASPADPVSTVSGLNAGATVLKWTISNGSCVASTDEVTINVTGGITTAVAGSDQSVCTGTASLSANSPSLGTGTWTVVSGPATVTTPGDPASAVSGLGVGDNTFRWTITNSPCAASEDDVVITRTDLPTTADAGADQTICASSTTLSGNAPAIGTGLWSVVSGTAVIASPSDPATAVSGLGTGAMVLRWTISSGSCAVSADEVTINVTGGITTAAAGSDQSVCTGTASLSANSPSLGTGTWTVVSGPAMVTTPGDPTSAVSGLGVGDNTFRWTITNSPCAASEDDVVITRTDLPTTADAGADQTVCASSTTLSGNAPAIGTGLWSVVSGTAVIASPADPVTAVSGLGTGATVLRWTISSGSCAVSADDVAINVSEPPTTANAGPDQSIVTNTTSLAGNTPSIGTGEWTSISGGGFIGDPDNPTTSVGALPAGANTYRWTISNGACASSSDEVTITVGNPPPFVIDGPDNIEAGQTYTFTVPDEPGASYFWTVPSGASIVSGNGTNTITVTFGSNASGTISVTKSSPSGTVSASKEVSAITSVTGPVDTDSYSVYPNPFSSETRLVITTPTVHKVLIKVMDMKGILIYESEEHYTNENILLGKEFAEGMYIVQAVYNDKLITIKVFKAE